MNDGIIRREWEWCRTVVRVRVQMRGGDDTFDFGLVMFKVLVWAIKEKILTRQLTSEGEG